MFEARIAPQRWVLLAFAELALVVVMVLVLRDSTAVPPLAPTSSEGSQASVRGVFGATADGEPAVKVGRSASVSEAEATVSYPLLIPDDDAANRNILADLTMAGGAQGAVFMYFPVPNPGSEGLRIPYIEVAQRPWVSEDGEPVTAFKESVAEDPRVGKAICSVRDIPALCVTARSPSDPEMNNSAYLRFVSKGVEVSISGGDSLPRLLGIARSMTR